MFPALRKEEYEEATSGRPGFGRRLCGVLLHPYRADAGQRAFGRWRRHVDSGQSDGTTHRCWSGRIARGCHRNLEITAGQRDLCERTNLALRAECSCGLRVRNVFQQGRIMSGDSIAPIACSLGPGELNDRQERIADLARRSLIHQHREGRALTLRYTRSAAAELRELVALEKECCAFLEFHLQEAHDAIELRITAPREAEALAEELFGHFDAPSRARGCNNECTCTGRS
ncbi:hypothetical protein [Variovorax sp. WS11]|uniref:hypothetical protein n=1 Tax=Variovorax sp. WS11 TaxID=1105204 RepID=UPI0011B25D41|nr:hypothetical protein [Variovorax sp. WS11]NDZ17194.1 hypothetical protein [Variovorax sp. WS11]